MPVTLVGLRGSDVRFVWSLYRASDRAPVEDWILQDAGGVKAPRDRSTYLVGVWVQLPQVPGRYVAVIEIKGDGRPLDSVSTREFPGLMGGPVGGGGLTPAPSPDTNTKPTTTRPTSKPPITVKPAARAHIRPRAMIAAIGRT